MIWECAVTVACIVGPLAIAAWLREHVHTGCGCEREWKRAPGKEGSS